MDTVCYGCVFASKKKEDHAYSGCYLGRIEQYKSVGAEVIEAFDGDKEFFVVKDRICAAYRGKNWDKEYEAQEVYNELAQNFMDVAILWSSVDDLDHLQILLFILNKNEVKPSNIHIILESESGDFVSKIFKIMDQNKIPWKVHNLSPGTLFWDSINLVGDKCSSYYYYVIFDYTMMEEGDVIDAVFKRTHIDLKPFSLCYSDNFIVNAPTHKMVKGSGENKNVVEKIFELAKEQDKENLIIEWDELLGRNNEY